jgi:hypothetical protein
MHLEGDETANGQKTFTTHPLVPNTNTQVDTANDPADTTKYATIAQVSRSVLLLSGNNIGVSQTVNGSSRLIKLKHRIIPKKNNHGVRGVSRR